MSILLGMSRNLPGGLRPARQLACAVLGATSAAGKKGVGWKPFRHDGRGGRRPCGAGFP
jgi:hypothetical protein